MDDDKEVTTTFILPEYTLTIHIEGQGEVEVDDQIYTEAITVPAGNELDLQAIAATDWVFEGWSGDTDHLADADSLWTTLSMPAQDVEILAHFDEDDATSLETVIDHEQLKVHVYPNPAEDVLRVEVGEAFHGRLITIHLYDVHGKTFADNNA